MPLVPNYVPTDWVDTVTTVDEAKMDKLDVAVDQHADAINALDTRLAAEEAQPDVPAVVNGKWIKGVGGAMVYSDILQADVSGLSAALNAKQDTSAKGAVNGYASLDSGGKVPTSQLPVPIDIRWAGTYSGATTYKEGDVVISNGISYLALRATTNETPTPWGSGAAGGGGGWDATAVLATQQDSSSTSAVDVPGLTLPLLASSLYEIGGLFSISSTSGAGLRLGINFSAAGATAETYWAGMQTATGANQTVSTAFTPPSQAWAAVAATPSIVMLTGLVHVGANAGNLVVQQQKITSGTGSVLVGSQLRVRKVG